MTEETIISSACRIMFNKKICDLSDKIEAKDIIDLSQPNPTYNAINGWEDFGATKSGVWWKDNIITTSISEFTLEKIFVVDSSLAILWMDKIIVDLINIKVFPKVQYLNDKSFGTGDTSGILIKFKIIS